MALLVASLGCSDIGDAIDNAEEWSRSSSDRSSGTSSRPRVKDPTCYETFDKFKEAMKAQGKHARDGEQWHHIVEQHAHNQAKFPGRVHCDDNLIKLPRRIHEEISGHYSSKRPNTRPRTVREVIREQSWDEQWAYGATRLRHHGYTPP